LIQEIRISSFRIWFYFQFPFLCVNFALW
jgi:hypothetical protein